MCAEMFGDIVSSSLVAERLEQETEVFERSVLCALRLLRAMLVAAPLHRQLCAGAYQFVTNNYRTVSHTIRLQSRCLAGLERAESLLALLFMLASSTRQLQERQVDGPVRRTALHCLLSRLCGRRRRSGPRSRERRWVQTF
jgi:hypothetical protein